MEFETAEFENFVVCAIDNKEGMVKADTVEQFKKLNQQGKQIVLLLTSPIADGVMELESAQNQNMIEYRKMQ